MSVHLTRGGAVKAAAAMEAEDARLALRRGHSSGLTRASMRPVVRPWLWFMWRAERP